MACSDPAMTAIGHWKKIGEGSKPNPIDGLMQSGVKTGGNPRRSHADSYRAPSRRRDDIR
jgi:hypothetical protein